MKKKYLLQCMCKLMIASTFIVLVTGCGSQQSDTKEIVKEETVADETKNISEETIEAVKASSDEIVEEEEEDQTQPKVYFSSKSGFYDEEFALELTCPVEGATIYYTTDGSVPTDASNKYEGPITLKNRSFDKNKLCARTDFCTDSTYIPAKKVKKANVIRAVAYFADGTSSEVTGKTYFIGIDREALYGDAPVISLMTDESNLFDYENGIFVLGKTYDDWIKEDPNNINAPAYTVHGNFSNKGKEWEKPVYVEYLSGNGKTLFSANMGLRTKGASTRTYLQKSMKLIAREEYGTKNIKKEIIPDNQRSDKTGNVSKYRSFVLRNGGNDNGFAKIRDPFLQSLVSERNMDTQQSTPCAVYIDGEYWGMYAITEDYTDKYIENNYDIDSKNVIIVKCGEIDEGEEEDILLYQDMYNFITQNDMSVSANYEKANSMLDIKGFMEYCAMQFYINNHDAFDKDNNWSLWRTREADKATEWSDGKWRILLYDTEFSSGVYTGGQEYDENNLIDIFNEDMDATRDFNCEYPLFNIFRALCENDDFFHDLINTMCDMRNYDFERLNAVAVLDDMSVNYQKLAPESILRYGPDWVIASGEPKVYYEQKLLELKKYINGRYTTFPMIMRNTFKYNMPVNVTVQVSDTSMGTVCVNNTLLDYNRIGSDSFVGSYFEEYCIRLTAVPKDGYKFVGWETKGDCTVDDSQNETINVTFSNKCTVKAIFEK